MAFRKDDPLYYRDKLTKLLERATSNGLKVVVENIPNGMELCFEAPNGDIVGIRLMED